jgi:hypothetical protein
MREITLLFHFIGFGLIATLSIAGNILNRQYKKAPDLQTKATILRAMKPIGLLSPAAIIIMLVTGIGNMQMMGIRFVGAMIDGNYEPGILDIGWLTGKVILYLLIAIYGVMFSITARKRGALVGSMAKGNVPANAEELLRQYDKKISLGYMIFPIVVIAILFLAIYGRLHGGQYTL